jgi:hypothetical protein
MRWHKLDSSSSGQGKMEGFCEDGKENSFSIESGKFLHKLRTTLHGLSYNDTVKCCNTCDLAWLTYSHIQE